MAENEDDYDDDNVSRRMEEAAALSAFYDADFRIVNDDDDDDAAACTSAVRRVVPSHQDGSWWIRVSSNLALLLELPPEYPSHSLPSPRLLRVSSSSSPPPPYHDKPPRIHYLEEEDRRIIQDLLELATPGYEVAIVWAEHLREQFGSTRMTHDQDDMLWNNNNNKEIEIEESQTTPSPVEEGMSAMTILHTTTTTATATATTPFRNTNTKLWLHVIRSHHLLDHAPDNFLSKGGTKYKLNGWYRYGTPGLAFCIVAAAAADDDDDCHLDAVESFMEGLSKKMPQKKFEIILSREMMDAQWNKDGWNEVTSMDPIQTMLSDDEFVSILNIQGGGGKNNNSAKTKPSSKNSSSRDNKGVKGKKNKKRK